MRALLLVGVVVLVGGSARAEEKGTAVKLGDLTSAAPAAWKNEPVTNKLRAYQFKLAKAEGDPADAELVVFPSGFGGTMEQNLARWERTFKGAKPAVQEFKVGAVPVTVQTLKGTYLFKPNPMAADAASVEKPDHTQIGVIVGNPDKLHFIRLIGPSKTVEAHAKEFMEWVKNFK